MSASAPLGTCLEMSTLQPHPRPRESEPFQGGGGGGVRPVISVLTNPPGDGLELRCERLGVPSDLRVGHIALLPSPSEWLI